MAAKSNSRSASSALTATAALQLFIELSAILTGQPVASATARRHLRALQAAAPDQQMLQLLKRFRSLKAAGADLTQGVKEALVMDPTLGPLVRSAVLLWFTGQLQFGQAAPLLASGDDYFQALMWSCVGAHPPALSDAYFGHWRYPPDRGPG